MESKRDTKTAIKLVTKTVEETDRIDIVKFEFTKEEADSISRRIMDIVWAETGDPKFMSGLFNLFARASTDVLSEAMKNGRDSEKPKEKEEPKAKEEPKKTEPKYKVGDKVLVRDDLRHAQRYGNDGFDATMMGDRVGKVCTVTEITYNSWDRPEIAGYRLDGKRGRFTEEMIVGLARLLPAQDAIKVGDKVRIVGEFKDSFDYGFYVNDEMREMAGKVVTISNIPSVYGGGIFKLKEIAWSWHIKMFDPTFYEPAAAKKTAAKKTTKTLKNGDKVLVCKNLELGKKYGGFVADADMVALAGKTVTIDRECVCGMSSLGTHYRTEEGIVLPIEAIEII